MHDLISRQELLRIIDLRIANKKDARKQMHSSLFVDGMEDGYLRIRSDVCQMPSAERKGKWIRENVVLTSNPPQYQWHCSECGRMVHWFTTEVLTKYCPNCGSRNKEEEKE